MMSVSAACCQEPYLLIAQLKLVLSLSAGQEQSIKALSTVHLLLELASSPDGEVALAAAHCLLKVTHLHPAQAAAVLAEEANVQLLAGLLAQQCSDPCGDARRPTERQASACYADLAPLLLLLLAAAAEAQPALLHERGDVLRPVVFACLAAVGDPGLKRRWAHLLGPQP